MMSSIFAKLG